MVASNSVLAQLKRFHCRILKNAFRILMGILRRILEDDVKMDLKKISCEDRQWMEVAQDNV